MSEDAAFKKEVQNRKKEFEDKKIELISRLCIDESENPELKEEKVVDKAK